MTIPKARKLEAVKSREIGLNTRSLSKKILICCVSLLIVGYVNSLWKNIEYHSWYDALQKPIISPSPSWIVGVIWTFMFIILGIAVGYIWHEKQTSEDEQTKKNADLALVLFIAQIIVNMTVPVFFFWMHNLYYVLFGAIVNLLLVIYLMFQFYHVKPLASLIMSPFLLWLIYAVLLDISFVMIN